MPKRNHKDKTSYIWASLRIVLGLIFLWAFADKMFGLGFSTCRTTDPITSVETVEVMCEASAIKGGSPTEGFLTYATDGVFEDFYQNLAGNNLVDILFMAGLGLIGICLVLGIGVNVAALSGIAMMLMMWSAVLPGENNPLLDDHIVYAIVMLGLIKVNHQQVWGLGQWWQSQPFVKKMPFLA